MRDEGEVTVERPGVGLRHLGAREARHGAHDQLRLPRVAAVHGRLADAGPRRDGLDREAVVALVGEHGERGVDDRLVALRAAGSAGSGDRHGARAGAGAGCGAPLPSAATGAGASTVAGAESGWPTFSAANSASW